MRLNWGQTHFVLSLKRGFRASQLHSEEGILPEKKAIQVWGLEQRKSVRTGSARGVQQTSPRLTRLKSSRRQRNARLTGYITATILVKNHKMAAMVLFKAILRDWTPLIYVQFLLLQFRHIAAKQVIENVP